MAAQYKTRCPHCQAQFRIGEEHLRQAKGQVRCGSCLKVFLATENLVGSPPKAASPGTPASNTGGKRSDAGQAKPRQTSGPEDWQMPGAKPDAPAGSRWTLGDEADAPSTTTGAGDHARDPKRDDESNDTRLNLGGLELSDSFLSAGQDDDDERLRDDFSDIAGVASGGSSGTTDESWAEQLLEELEDEPDVPLNQSHRPASSPGARAHGTGRQQSGRQPAPAGEDDEWLHDVDSDDGFGPDSDSLLDSLPHEDLSVLDLDQAPDRARTEGDGIGEIVRWGLASLALLGLLAGQYAVFEFDELARRPALRPVYAAFCERLPCELPPLTDIAALRASNLVVRPHPEVEGALMIDLLLHNHGTYAQPWPDLELGFTSLEGAPVASRRFLPSEYLRGDTASSERIPADTPVHVSLEIVDPGDRAVNYTLRPLPPGGSDRG